MNKPEPPGVIIQKFLDQHKMSIEDLASRIPCSPTLVFSIVEEHHEVTWMMARKLAKVIGGTEQYWLDLNKSYQDYQRFLDTNALGHRYDELG